MEAQPGLGTVRVLGSRPLHCGTPAGGGDGRGLGPHIQAPQWSSVCWQGPGGGTASGPSSSLPPTFPYFPPSWPDAWVPGGGRLRAPGSASPPGDGDSCPLVPLGTPSRWGRGTSQHKGLTLRTPRTLGHPRTGARRAACLAKDAGKGVGQAVIGRGRRPIPKLGVTGVLLQGGAS